MDSINQEKNISLKEKNDFENILKENFKYLYIYDEKDINSFSYRAGFIIVSVTLGSEKKEYSWYISEFEFFSKMKENAILNKFSIKSFLNQNEDSDIKKEAEVLKFIYSGTDDRFHIRKRICSTAILSDSEFKSVSVLYYLLRKQEDTSWKHQ